MNRNNLALFSGIGGLELGLEWAGFTTVGQVEISEWCRTRLARHWPEVPRHDDVSTAVEWWTGQSRPDVGLVCGGFPCQPASVAGLRLGPEDPRWLWPLYYRVAEALQPPFLLIENVPNLRSLGLLDVLQGLASLGFNAWWGRVPAAAVGAPHLRWRIFIIAARQGIRFTPGGWPESAITQWDGRKTWHVANPECVGLEGPGQPAFLWESPASLRRRPAVESDPQDVADAGSPAGDAAGSAGEAVRESGPVERPGRRGGLEPAAAGDRGDLDAAEPGLGRGTDGLSSWLDRWSSGEWERGIPWTASGMSERTERLTALGNAVVPAVGHYIGRIILAGAEHGTTAA